MSEVKRYGLNWCEVTERTVFSHDQKDGDYVKLSDYAALQQKLDAVLAEVVAIREQAENVYASGYNQGHLNTVDGCAYAVNVKDEFYHNALQVMLEVETPATEALLNAVRAEGVEMWLKQLNGLKGWTVRNAEDFAAQLRAETDTTSSQYEPLAGGK